MSTENSVQKKGQKTNGVATKKATQHVEKSNMKVDEILSPTANARIKKLENFQLLAKRHQFLVDKTEQLDKFIISSDGTKEKIVLKNAEGYEFEVSNSQVVEKVTDLIKAELAVFVEKSEKEVLTFPI